jgi:hypothetical protein
VTADHHQRLHSVPLAALAAPATAAQSFKVQIIVSKERLNSSMQHTFGRTSGTLDCRTYAYPPASSNHALVAPSERKLLASRAPNPGLSLAPGPRLRPGMPAAAAGVLGPGESGGSRLAGQGEPSAPAEKRQKAKQHIHLKPVLGALLGWR